MNDLHTDKNILNVTQEFIAMIKLPDEKSKKLNYLVVIPKLTDDYNSTYDFPVGIAYISAALKVSGRVVFTFNMNYKTNPIESLQQCILENNIDVVMSGGCSENFWDMKTIFDAAKGIKPSVINIAGGGIITADPETAMKAFGTCVDYGVIGEGEITINALAYALETEQDVVELAGICFFRNGELLINEKWSSISDLDILPFPDYEGLEYGLLFGKNISTYLEKILGRHIALLSLSRSCLYGCTFCFKTCGNKYRQMSISKFFEHCNWFFPKYPVKGLFLASELAFSKKETIVEFCRFIKPFNMKWIACVRLDAMTKEVLLIMKESGCDIISVGIESACNEILKSMRKNITIEQIEKAMGFASEVGITVQGNIIIGDLEETVDTAWRSIDWWLVQKNISNSILAVRCIHSYPGSFVYKTAVERGIIKDPVLFLKSGCSHVNLSKMTDDEYYTFWYLVYFIFQFRIPYFHKELLNAKTKANSDLTVNVSGLCPHCSQKINYEHFEIVFHLGHLMCSACKEFVGINPIEYCDFNRLNKNAETLINGKRTAIWGINLSNFYYLLKVLPVFAGGGGKVKIINKEDIVIPYGAGYVVKTLFGKEIFRPDIIREENIEIVIVPNNPKVFNKIKKQCVAEFPNVKRIIHITELMG